MQQIGVQILSTQYQVVLFVAQPQVFDPRAWLCFHMRACALEADRGSFADDTLATQVMQALLSAMISYRLAPLITIFQLLQIQNQPHHRFVSTIKER